MAQIPIRHVAPETPRDLREVPVDSASLRHLEQIIGARHSRSLRQAVGAARDALRGRQVIHVNSTANGGGVAEILHRVLAYTRGAGINARWLVIEGDERFFRFTKRLHHLLHARPGTGPDVDDDARRHYEATAARNAEGMLGLVQRGDVVVLHDPQVAGLVPHLRGSGAHVVWQCHIGADRANDHSRLGWRFLRPYLEGVDAFLFSRPAYVPDWLGERRVRIIPPSIDPLSPKNVELDAGQVQAIVRHIGLVAGEDGRRPTFPRHDGTVGQVDRTAEVTRSGPRPTMDEPLVVQVSRWDPLKDMQGVLEGFCHVDIGRFDAHLALVGPDVSEVSDDPEGAEVLADCLERWRRLPAAVRSRVHLVSLPMDNMEENAVMVNAIQRHATIAVQKSLAEGFGLTVTEAMWKTRPVVASRVGGIQDQIEDGVHGLLLTDPTDPAQFAAATERLLADPAFAQGLGRRARQRTVAQFLDNRLLEQQAALYRELVEA